jgi:hypothetical protein
VLALAQHGDGGQAAQLRLTLVHPDDPATDLVSANGANTNTTTAWSSSCDLPNTHAPVFLDAANKEGALLFATVAEDATFGTVIILLLTIYKLRN